MNIQNNSQLIRASLEFRDTMTSDTALIDIAEIISNLASQLDLTTAALCEKERRHDAAIAEIKAQCWIEAKDFTKSMLATDSVDHFDFLFDGKIEQLRQEVK